MGKNDDLRFSLKARMRSFANAFSGLGLILKTEHNFRIHLSVLLLVVISGFLLGISAAEWIMISIAAGMVLSAECINTAIEYLADEFSPEYNEKIRKVKDIAAAGVLISAIAAAITGLIIFVPGIIKLIKNWQ
jgi:diacylglycerol kinase (ATP)